VVAPAGTPAPIVGKLNGVINESLKAPDMKDLVVRFGSEARVGSPQEFGTFLAGETRKWANIAKQAGVALD
jgi:tripartite-type tricarboxylate transporter receptor subunit TctC